jgi:hypothetical protein
MIWHITHVSREQFTIPEVDGTDRELGEGRPAMHKLLIGCQTNSEPVLGYWQINKTWFRESSGNDMQLQKASKTKMPRYHQI